MEKKNKSSKKKSTSEENFKKPYLNNCIPSDGSGVLNSEIFKSLSGLGEMASAISVALSTDFLSSYKGILDSQSEILKSVSFLHDPIVSIPDQLRENVGMLNFVLAPMAESVLDIGLGAANANKLFSEGLISSKNLLDVQKVSNLAIDALRENQSYFTTIIENADNLSSLVVDPSFLSMPMSAAGIDILTRAMPSFPVTVELPTLDRIREGHVFDEPEVKKAHETLDSLLNKIDPILVEIRKGCWIAFEEKKADYIRQSSSSMRGLVDTMLRQIAPDNKVVETDFFKKSPAAKTERGLPTRKARIYYAADYDTKKTEHLERLAAGLDGLAIGLTEAHKNLSAWDHEPLDNDQFVYGSFIAIEGCIIALLSEIREVI